MRYKILALAPILLLATPPAVFGQEMSPIVIKTGKPVPSVVRSGEPLKITYRAEYIDLVLIEEDQILQPGNTAGQFEAIKLEVVTLPHIDDEKLGIIHIQEFTYTFRIIKPEKGLKKVPSFDFVWVEKKAGTTKDNAKQTAELQKIPTDEVSIGYISSSSGIKPPPIDIRDEMIFSSPSRTGTQLRWFGYGLIGLLSLLALGVVVFWTGVGQSKPQQASGKTAGENPEAQMVVEVVPNLSPKKARKKFLQALRLMQANTQLAHEEGIGLETEVYNLLREYVLAEFSESPVKASASDTPNELYTRLVNLGEKQRKEAGSKYSAALRLSKKMENYYADMESRSSVYLPRVLHEIGELVNIVEDLSWKSRMWKALRKKIGARNA